MCDGVSVCVMEYLCVMGCVCMLWGVCDGMSVCDGVGVGVCSKDPPEATPRTPGSPEADPVP